MHLGDKIGLLMNGDTVLVNLLAATWLFIFSASVKDTRCHQDCV